MAAPRTRSRTPIDIGNRTHGTLSGYGAKCGCDPCYEAGVPGVSASQSRFHVPNWETPNYRKSWTTREIEAALTNRPLKVIAEELGRTTSAVAKIRNVNGYTTR